MGFKDIKVTKMSRDKGIDLICYKDIIDGINTIRAKKFIIQAKREATEMPDMSLISGTDIMDFYIQNKSNKIFDWEPKLSIKKLKNIIIKNKKKVLLKIIYLE